VFADAPRKGRSLKVRPLLETVRGFFRLPGVRGRIRHSSSTSCNSAPGHDDTVLHNRELLHIDRYRFPDGNGRGGISAESRLGRDANCRSHRLPGLAFGAACGSSLKFSQTPTTLRSVNATDAHASNLDLRLFGRAAAPADIHGFDDGIDNPPFPLKPTKKVLNGGVAHFWMVQQM